MQDILRTSGLAVGADVLDVCTGSGALAMTAMSSGARSVTAVDLSARSVITTWANSRLQRLSVQVRRGNLFEPVSGQQFDLVVANPPYVPARTDDLPRHRAARCWDGGMDGRSLVDRICASVRDALRPGGHLLLVHSDVIGEERSVDLLEQSGLQASVTARRRTPFGPVMTARAELLRSRGLHAAADTFENLVVIQAARV